VVKLESEMPPEWGPRKISRVPAGKIVRPFFILLKGSDFGMKP
jgi:hypothetical protein